MDITFRHAIFISHTEVDLEAWSSKFDASVKMDVLEPRYDTDLRPYDCPSFRLNGNDFFL